MVAETETIHESTRSNTKIYVSRVNSCDSWIARSSITTILLGLYLCGADVILGHSNRALILSQRFDPAQAVSKESTVEKRPLVFIGTVRRIYPVGSARSRRRWAVVTKVDRVVSGEFAGETFTFTVHSPARMGLQVGVTYTFEAEWRDGAYVVNDTKWMKPVETRTRKSSSIHRRSQHPAAVIIIHV